MEQAVYLIHFLQPLDAPIKDFTTEYKNWVLFPSPAVPSEGQDKTIHMIMLTSFIEPELYNAHNLLTDFVFNFEWKFLKQ